MNARSCGRKGRDFERAITRSLAAVFGREKVRRGIQYSDGRECADVIAPGLWVECKAQRKTNPRAALRQAMRGAAGRAVRPVAVCKDDRRPPVVLMQLGDFLEFLREWNLRRAR
jgi:hypothetical protein